MKRFVPLVIFFVLFGNVTAAAFESTIPAHIPIAIKIKKESEARFKDQYNDKWVNDFELELTNTGTKPIYALDLSLRTDIVVGSCSRLVFGLTYGRTELHDIQTKAGPTDIPIEPGQTVSLKISAGSAEPLDFARRYGKAPLPRIDFDFLSFGDGTAYDTDGKSLPSAPINPRGLLILPRNPFREIH